MTEKNYKIESHPGYTIIKLDTILDYYNCKSFTEEIDSITEQPNHVLIDCEQIVTLPKDWVRAFTQLKVGLKLIDKEMKLIHVNQAVTAALRAEGVDKIFKVAKNANEALKEFGLGVKRTLNMEFINPFLSATLNVLKIQAGTEAKHGQIYIKKASDHFVGDISGIIGIVSDTFTGSVVISFPEKSFLNIISQMLGEEIKVIDKDVCDGAGEIINIIFGQAKISLNELGYGIKTAIPSVVTGKDHTLSAQTKGPVMVIPFESNMGPFFIEIGLSS